jgi:ribose 5-phosphate isomerase RpiB
MIAIGSDHGGVELKKFFLGYLRSRGVGARFRYSG